MRVLVTMAMGLCLGLGLTVGVPAVAASEAHHGVRAGRATHEAQKAHHAHRARARHVRIKVRHVAGHRVLVSGHTTRAKAKVRIERRGAHRWVPVLRVAVRQHRFARQLRQGSTRADYRAVSGAAKSRKVTVRLRPAKPTTTTVSTPPVTTPVTPPTATPTTDPTPVPTDSCGARPQKADGSYWSCTFDDEFDGAALDRSKWVPQTNFTTGTASAYACYVDSPDNIAVSDGSLHLTVRHTDTPVACANKGLGATSSYSAGSVMTYHTFSQQYGRFEVRMKTPETALRGLQSDFWLWPDDRVASTAVWPAAGEMDVVEQYSQYPDLNIPFLHYTAYDNWGPRPGLNTAWNCAIQRGAFNTYRLDWTPTSLTISINGKTCLVNSSGNAAFQKPYIMALTQALGTGTNALTGSTPLPATMDVDYVRVWQ